MTEPTKTSGYDRMCSPFSDAALEESYAGMVADGDREAEAGAWCDALAGDVALGVWLTPTS